jgi:membrane protease YdiL (CAAX protease family)
LSKDLEFSVLSGPVGRGFPLALCRAGLGRSRLDGKERIVWVPLLLALTMLLSASPILGLDGAVDAIESHRFVAQSSFVAWFLLFLMLPVFLEEVLFRGVLIDALRTRCGPATCVLSSAVAFAAFHPGVGSRVFALLVGIALGSLAFRAHSVRETLLIHLLYNAWVFIPELI